MFSSPGIPNTWVTPSDSRQRTINSATVWLELLIDPPRGRFAAPRLSDTSVALLMALNVTTRIQPPQGSLLVAWSSTERASPRRGGPLKVVSRVTNARTVASQPLDLLTSTNVPLFQRTVSSLSLLTASPRLKTS